MSQATTSNQEPILKRLYPTGIADPLYKRSKLAMMMKKDTNFGGEGRYVNVKLSGTAGGSSDFATAIASEAPTYQKRFFVTHKKEYQTFSIQGDLIQRSKGNQNALMDAVKQETDSALYSFWRAIAARIWGNEGGSLAQISASATLASTTLPLRTVGDVVRFEVGQRLQFASDNGTGSSPAGLRDGGATLTVVSVNKASGSTNVSSVTVSALLSTISGITVNDYVFRAGDYANAMTGVRGWNPTTAPTGGESFFGVDRTVGDVERQRGVIYSTTGDTTYEQKLIRALARGSDFGVEANTVFVNPIDMGNITLEFGTNKRAFQDDKSYRIGYGGLYINGPDGDVRIISEPDVPQGYFWMTKPEQFTLRTAGECPMPLDEDTGKLLLRLEGDDAYRGRFGAYGNVFNENPGNSVQGAF